MGFLSYDAAQDMPDQFGRVAIVTGGNSGIGFEICRALCYKQAVVYMAVRDIKSAKRWAGAQQNGCRRPAVE